MRNAWYDCIMTNSLPTAPLDIFPLVASQDDLTKLHANLESMIEEFVMDHTPAHFIDHPSFFDSDESSDWLADSRDSILRKIGEMIAEDFAPKSIRKLPRHRA